MVSTISLAFFTILMISSSIEASRGVIHISFEVENKEEFCLFHNFNESIEYIAEFGVLKGGNFDIDFSLESPSKKVLYSAQRINKKETIKFHSSQMGDFKFCFNNNFSPLTHKIVFFSLSPADERYKDSLRNEAGNNLPVVMTASEFRLNHIHANMYNVSEIQRFYRVEELIDRNFADMLNNKINILSVINFFTILFVSFAQVNFLKYLFNKKSVNVSQGSRESLLIRPQINF